MNPAVLYTALRDLHAAQERLDLSLCDGPEVPGGVEEFRAAQKNLVDAMNMATAALAAWRAFTTAPRGSLTTEE